MFKNDLSEIRQKRDVTIKVEGSTLPNTVSTFFRSKQEEIYRQYESARIFLRYAASDSDYPGWKYWLKSSENEEVQQLQTKYFSEKMFEASLMFYNVIVDLSWVLCYVSAEYVVYTNDKTTTFDKLQSIEAAAAALREEENVCGPGAEGNPFTYLKRMVPALAPAVDLVIDFWKQYSSSEIRRNYNYIKHRGKPLYTEVEALLASNRLLSLYSGKTECPSDVRDVQKVLSLQKCIEDLVEFDDGVLFPYIKKLIEIIEAVIKPSEYII